MTTDVERPDRRRWIRRFVVVSVLAILMAGWWFYAKDTEEIRKARNVRLGQTIAEVSAIMGHDYTISFGGYQSSQTAMYGRFQYEQLLLALKIQRWTGWSGLMPGIHDWPVHVRFNESGKVDRIKRGREIVER
jgi:hypothetical protein